MSTIFISHSSADNALAVELLDWLKIQGYRSVFLDLSPDEGIEAGEHWEKVLYRELVSCSVVLALVTENWLASKWCFAEATHARSGGKPLLGLAAERGVQPAILADTQSIDYSPDNRTDAYQRLAEALRRAIDPQGLGRWDPTRPLFPGLLYFDERDAPIFFGRRRLGRAIYQKLRELQAKPPGSERLLLVFGPSGSGKSSVVRAGTLPHVHACPDAWITLGPFRPTEGWPEPLRQSMDVLAGTDEVALAAKLREIADQLRSEAKASKAAILLIIDQLEEALDVKDGTEAAFWLPLSRLLAPNDTPFMAMATLRSDFMGDFQKRSARTAVRFGSFPLEPMSPEDLREIIAGPCRVAGIAIEAGLVDALVEDAGDEQALPLLALALNRLWLRYEAKQGGFSVADYRDGLGGMRGLIDREAESTLAGKGLREVSVMDAFLSLTRLAREGVLARQPIAWDGLETEAQKSLEPFIGARLLVRYSVDGDNSIASEKNGTVVIDLIHETLLSGWKRLHDWVARPENRDFLPWREELRHKVTRWSQANELKSLLLEGSELKEAKKWLNAKRLALNTQEAAYIHEALEASKISMVKFAVAAVVLAAAGGGWWRWTRTDIYQIKVVEDDLPEITRSAVASQVGGISTLHTDILSQLTRLGRSNLALIMADKIDDAREKAYAFRRIAGALAKAGQPQQAIATADRLDDARDKANTLGDIAEALAKAGQIQQAVQLNEQALATTNKIVDATEKADTIVNIAEMMAEAGQTQLAVHYLEQALATADNIEKAEQKANTLGYIARVLAKVGQTQQALHVFEQALITASENINDEWKANILEIIALAQAKAGQTQQALTTVDKIDQAERKVDTLENIAKALAEAGQIHEALAVMHKIENSERKFNNLSKIAEILAKSDQIQQALIVADKIDNAEQKSKNLWIIADVLAKSGQTQQAVQVFEQAIAAADKIDNVEQRSEILGDIADKLAKAGQIQQAAQVSEQAIAAADKISNADRKARTLKVIAKLMAKAGLNQQAVQVFELAKAVTDKIDDSDTKSSVLREIGTAQAQVQTMAGQTQQALDGANKIDDAIGKVQVLESIAEALTEAGKAQLAVHVFEQALTTVDTINDVEWKTQLLGSLAEALLKAVQSLMEADQTQPAVLVLKQAQALADEIDNAEWKAEFLAIITTGLAVTGQAQLAVEALEQTLVAADKIEDARGNAELLKGIAEALVETGQPHLALTAVDKINSTGEKAEALKNLASTLADKGMLEQTNMVLDKAVRITENISDERKKSEIYGSVAAIYAQLTQYHPARVTAEKSKLANDTLIGYMAILRYYTIEKHPELAEKLAKLEKEDKD